MRQLLHQLSVDNNLVPLHLWQREATLKRRELSVVKYFVQNCAHSIGHTKWRGGFSNQLQ